MDELKKLIWRVRFALILWDRTGFSMHLRHCWQCSEAGWDSNLGWSMTPAEAVTEELACWSE